MCVTLSTEVSDCTAPTLRLEMTLSLDTWTVMTQVDNKIRWLISCVGYRILVGYALRLTSVTHKPLSALPHNSTVSVPITARQYQSFVLYTFLNLGFNICSFTLPQHNIFSMKCSCFLYREFLVTFRDCFCCQVTVILFYIYFHNAVYFPSICWLSFVVWLFLCF